MQLWDWAYDWLFKYRKLGWCLKDKACNDLTIRSALSNAFSTKLQSLPDPVLSENKTTSLLTEEWSKLTKIITDASTETLGYTTRRHHDWFDENNIAICKLHQAKNKPHVALLYSPSCADLRNKWKYVHNHVQKELHQMENVWWVERARKIQQFSDTYDMHFYTVIKAVCGPTHLSVHPLRSKDGSTLVWVCCVLSTFLRFRLKIKLCWTIYVSGQYFHFQLWSNWTSN